MKILFSIKYIFVEQIVNNETLKLNNLGTELDDNESETALATERAEQLKLITQNISHLHELNQQLECQYLRFTDDMLIAKHNNTLPSNLTRDDDDEHHQYKSTSSTTTTTTNGHDEHSEGDSISFTDEQRHDMDDLNQQKDDEQQENYDELLAQTIEILTNQSKKINEE